MRALLNASSTLYYPVPIHPLRVAIIAKSNDCCLAPVESIGYRAVVTNNQQPTFQGVINNLCTTLLQLAFFTLSLIYISDRKLVVRRLYAEAH